MEFLFWMYWGLVSKIYECGMLQVPYSYKELYFEQKQETGKALLMDTVS